MINTFESELGQSVKMIELYDYLEMTPTYYNRWVTKEVIKNPYLIEGVDYCTVVQVKEGSGRWRKEYNINIDSAKKLCMVSKSKKGEIIRNELVKLTKQVENAVLVSSKQVIEIMRMIKVFSVYEHRKLALQKNAENYITNALIINPKYSGNHNMLYGKFHQWRNEVLNTGKEFLSERVKEYCLVERRRIPAKFTQDEALTMMGEYEQIKNAIWDLLCSQNKSEEMINNICNLAQDMAKEMKPFLERLNQSNLFFTQIELSEVKTLGLKS